MEYRNYLAHNCYKEKLLKNELRTIESVGSFVEELNNYECHVRELNDLVVKILENHKLKTIVFVKNN